MYSVPLSGNQNSALVSIGTNISSENASIANASITSLSVVEFKAANFSPNTISVSTLNVSSLNLDPSYVFPVLNVNTLNSVEESFVNVSAVNISANQITADNIQTLLTAGDNINISNNVISALNNNLPATGNFTTLNTSQINASNLSTGDLTFGSNFTLSNKFLTVNSTTNITENSGDLITSGAVYNALNKFSVNISDGRSLTNTKLYEGGDVIKPIIPGTVNSIKTNVDAGTSQNIMKVFYTTKFGPTAILSAVANFGYQVSGSNEDRITARLEYNNGTNNNIGQQEQLWINGAGGGTRSGVLSPRQGVRQSGVAAGTQVYFQIIIQNDSDDTFTFLTPNACNFHITESLDNAGSDLNLNTGNLQADEANFNSLTVQAGSGSGQATIGRTYLGNNAFSNMACLSVNGNDGANNYGFAQVANNQTIMNAMPSAYNSFRCENVEVASIGQIGLGIGLGVNNTAVFPLEVSGNSLVSGIMFANEIDTADADITNISNTNLSGTNATFQEINVSGNLIVNGTTFTTTNLTAGENITISNNVISAFFGSGGQVNLNYIQVDGGVDIGGVLNVSQTSNFSNSVNVGDILYVGEAGNHEGSVVVYSNIVGDNYTTKINSSTLEVNTSATGNLSSINFFVGNNKSLEITNSGIEATNIITDIIDSTELTTDVLTFIDGRATFRLNTPQLNASNASIDTVEATTIICDVLETDELDLDVLNVSTLNFSVGVADQLNTSDFTTQTANISEIVIDATQGIIGLVVNSEASFTQGVFISGALNHTASDMFLGSPAQEPNNIDGGNARSRINLWGTNPSFVGEIGMRFGVHEDYTAGAKIGSFGGVERYNIEFNGVDCFDLDNVSTTIHNKLNASNISGDGITANMLTLDASLTANSGEIMNDLEVYNDLDVYNDLFVANRIDATTIDALDVIGDNGDFGALDATTIKATTTNTSTINSSNGNFSSMVVNATGSFQAVVANTVNVAGTLNTTNIPGFQKELTAGDNVSILNDVISVNIDEFPSDANFSTITSQVGNFSTINADTSIVGTANSSFINTSFFSCIDEAGFSGTLNANIISCNELDADEIISPQIIGTNARVTSLQTSSLNISDPSSGLATNIVRSGGNTTLTSIAGSVIINTNTNSTARAMIIGPDNLIQTRTIQNAGLMETRNFSVDENVSVAGSLSVAQLSINGNNASTASIAFSSDFNYDTFSNTLSLATTATQAIQNVLDVGLDTASVNASSLNVDGLTTLDAVAISQSVNALVANLNTINSSGTANISVINNSTLNSKKSNISTMNASNCNALNSNFSVCDVNGSFTVGNIMGGPAVFSSIQSTNLLRGANASVDNNMSVAGTLRATVVNCNDVDCLKVITNNISVTNISVATRLTTPNLTVSNSFSFGGTLSTNQANITTINNDTLNTKTVTAQFSLAAPLANITTVNATNVNITNNFACKDITCDDINARGGSVLKMPTGNFSTINASNIVGYQKTLTAGSGILISGTTISATAEALPANANFSSVTATTGNFSTINTLNISANTGNISTFSTETLNVLNQANFGNVSLSNLDVNFNVSVNQLLRSNDGFFSGTLTSLNINNLSFNSVFSNISTLNASVINGDNLSTASISFDPTDFNFSNGELSLVGSATLPADANFSSVTATTGNFSTINASVINGANLSTASIAFSSDFNYDTFSNTLTLAEDAGQAVQDALEDGIVTASVNTSSLNVDGLTTLDAVAVSVQLDALVANLNTINSSGTANISTINASVISGDNLSTASISFDPTDFNFSNGELSLVGGGGGGGGGGSLPADANFSSVTADTIVGGAITVNNLTVGDASNLPVADFVGKVLSRNTRMYINPAVKDLDGLTSYNLTMTREWLLSNYVTHNNGIFTFQNLPEQSLFIVTALVGVESDAYTGRVQWQMTPFLNNANFSGYGRFYTSTRGSNQISRYSTLMCRTLVGANNGQSYRLTIDCNKEADNTFGSSMNGLRILTAPILTFEYVGPNAGALVITS